MSYDFDPTKKGDNLIRKEAYTKQAKQIRKVHDGYRGVDVAKEEAVEVYDKRTHEDAIRKAMSEAFNELTENAKKSTEPLKIEVDENETYHGIPVKELSPYMKLQYALEKAAKQDNDPDASDV